MRQVVAAAHQVQQHPGRQHGQPPAQQQFAGHEEAGNIDGRSGSGHGNGKSEGEEKKEALAELPFFNDAKDCEPIA
ncbi:hypothetical protein GCM10028824_26400 [Hymenobacter segetis]